MIDALRLFGWGSVEVERLPVAARERCPPNGEVGILPTNRGVSKAEKLKYRELKSRPKISNHKRQWQLANDKWRMVNDK